MVHLRQEQVDYQMAYQELLDKLNVIVIRLHREVIMVLDMALVDKATDPAVSAQELVEQDMHRYHGNICVRQTSWRAHGFML
jgi:hypothetical protein